MTEHTVNTMKRSALFLTLVLAPAIALAEPLTLRLDVGIRGSFAYHSFSRAGGSLWLLEGVPDLKLRFAASDRVGLYGDFGIGLANIHHSWDDGVSDNSVAAAIQFGFGVAFGLSPGLNLIGEVRFDIYTRSGSSTFIALPTIGLEFF